MHHPKHNILVFFYYLLLTYSVVALGQPVTELYELYTNKEMTQLYEKTKELSQKYPDNRRQIVKDFPLGLLLQPDKKDRRHDNDRHDTYGIVKNRLCGHILTSSYNKSVL